MPIFFRGAATPAATTVFPRIAAELEKKRLKERLQLAQKMEAIGTLAGGIAHDFNHILAAIMGHEEISLLDLSAGSPLRHNLEAVRNACNRARDLVITDLTMPEIENHGRNSARGPGRPTRKRLAEPTFLE